MKESGFFNTSRFRYLLMRAANNYPALQELCEIVAHPHEPTRMELFAEWVDRYVRAGSASKIISGMVLSHVRTPGKIVDMMTEDIVDKMAHEILPEASRFTYSIENEKTGDKKIKGEVLLIDIRKARL